MRNCWRWGGGAVVAGFLALQLTNPSLKNPPVAPGRDLMATNAPPPQIASLLKNACCECHSNETHWPWYSHIAPVSWWIVGHVNDARSAINFSDWPHEHPTWVRKRWRHIADEVESGEMPLASYTWIHPKARLSADERKRLVDWAREQGGE